MAIAKIIVAMTPRDRAAVLAYQQALRDRKDWHAVVLCALRADEAEGDGEEQRKLK